VALLDISCPLIGDVGLELHNFACAWSIRDVDACTQREIVRVLVFVNWSDKVGKWVLVNVWKVVVVKVARVEAVDARWEGVRSKIGRHCGDGVFDDST